MGAAQVRALHEAHLGNLVRCVRLASRRDGRRHAMTLSRSMGGDK
jgi:hypothetical protein